MLPSNFQVFERKSTVNEFRRNVRYSHEDLSHFFLHPSLVLLRCIVARDCICIESMRATNERVSEARQRTRLVRVRGSSGCGGRRNARRRTNQGDVRKSVQRNDERTIDRPNERMVWKETSGTAILLWGERGEGGRLAFMHLCPSTFARSLFVLVVEEGKWTRSKLRYYT